MAGYKVSKSLLKQLEEQLDELFSKIDVDVEFTSHFFERLNDPRNKEPIKISELRSLFKKVYREHRDIFDKNKKNLQAVLKDLSTDINIPFILKWDEKNDELDLVSKTVMRKKNFQTSNPVYSVENTNITYSQLKEKVKE